MTRVAREVKDLEWFHVCGFGFHAGYYWMSRYRWQRERRKFVGFLLPVKGYASVVHVCTVDCENEFKFIALDEKMHLMFWRIECEPSAK